MTEFVHKTYRCVWLTECYGVDQYGARQNETFYRAEWPTRAEAMADLEHVAKRCNFTGRWIPINAPHSYAEAGITYREVLKPISSTIAA